MRTRKRSVESQLVEGIVDEGVHELRLVARFPARTDAEPSGFVDDTTYWVGALTDYPELHLGSGAIDSGSQSTNAMPPPL
jgi:hypothetical protein